MTSEGEDRFDGLLLRLAEEHTEGGIKEVSKRGIRLPCTLAKMRREGELYLEVVARVCSTPHSSCTLSLDFCDGRLTSTLESIKERRRK